MRHVLVGAALGALAACHGGSKGIARRPELRACTVRRDAGDGHGTQRVMVNVWGVSRGELAPAEYYLHAAAAEVGTRIPVTAAFANQRSGYVRARIRSNSQLIDLEVDSAGSSGALDDALMAAVRSASNMGVLEFQPFERSHGPVVVRFQVSLEPEPPATVVADRPPRVMPGNPPPQFVTPKGAVGTETVVTELRIDEDGRANPGHFRLLDPKYQSVVGSIIAVLPHWRYFPADSNGCAVTKVVHQEFRIGR